MSETIKLGGEIRRRRNKMIINDYQCNSRVLYTFVPNKSFDQLLGISLKNFIFLKTFNSEISFKYDLLIKILNL